MEEERETWEGVGESGGGGNNERDNLMEETKE